MTVAYVYLDTSVYLGFLLRESSALSFLSVMAHKKACTSVLLLVESERNLVRMSRSRILSSALYQQAIRQLHKDKESFLFKDVTMDLCMSGEYPPVRLPRASDLVHLRTARWFQERGELEGFITLDEPQKAAAYDFGLPVIDHH